MGNSIIIPFKPIKKLKLKTLATLSRSHQEWRVKKFCQTPEVYNAFIHDPKQIQHRSLLPLTDLAFFLQTIIAPLNFTSWQCIMNLEETTANPSIWPLQQSYKVGYYLHLIEEKQTSMGVKISQRLKAHEEFSSKACPPALFHHILGHIASRFTLHHLLLTMTITWLPLEAACPPHMLSQL